jgi:hypothetical protein
MASDMPVMIPVLFVQKELKSPQQQGIITEAQYQA